MSSLPSEVCVSSIFPGIPAHPFYLPSVTFISRVDDKETQDLDFFIKEVTDVPDDTFFRLRTMSVKLIPGVTTIKKYVSCVSWYLCAFRVRLLTRKVFDDDI